MDRRGHGSRRTEKKDFIYGGYPPSLGIGRFADRLKHHSERTVRYEPPKKGHPAPGISPQRSTGPSITKSVLLAECTVVLNTPSQALSSARANQRFGGGAKLLDRLILMVRYVQ